MSGAEAAELFVHPDRNLAMELVRATEAAAIRATPFMGAATRTLLTKQPLTLCGNSSPP